MNLEREELERKREEDRKARNERRERRAQEGQNSSSSSSSNPGQREETIEEKTDQRTDEEKMSETDGNSRDNGNTESKTETQIMVVHSAPAINVPYLRSLRPEEVISFLHSYDSARDMVDDNQGQKMHLKAYIDGQIVRELAEVYHAMTEEQVRRELQRIIDDYDVGKYEDGFDILKQQLTWPKGEPTMDRAVTQYIHVIKKVMSKEDLENDKVILKQIVKEAIKKLPAEFELEVSDHSNLKKLITAGQKKLLPKDAWEALQEVQVKKDNPLKLFEQYLRMKAWALKSKNKTIDIIDVRHGEVDSVENRELDAVKEAITLLSNKLENTQMIAAAATTSQNATNMNAGFNRGTPHTLNQPIAPTGTLACYFVVAII